VTLTQIAHAAGCSLPTASRVFRDPHLVAEHTRRRVLTAARQLGYEPPHAGLPRTPTTLAFVGGDLGNPLFAEIIRSVLASARQRNIAVYLTEPERDPVQEGELVRTLIRHADALILWSPTMSDDRLREINAELATVVVNRPAPGCINISIDDRPGMRQATEHLRALGHTRCAFVAAGGDTWTISHRIEAVRSGCAHNDIKLIEFGPYESAFSSGVQAADPVIASGATAVIAQNDQTAQGLVRQLTVRGVRVPDDISVIGADDSVIARQTLPALTTVKIPIQKIVSPAMTIITNILAGRSYPEPPAIDVPTALVIRDSTSHAPA